MRRWMFGAALCLLLAGCSRQQGRKDEFPFTPFPYRNDDEFYESIAKTFVNVPVWTLEGVFALAFFAAYLWIVSGAPGISRK